MNKERDIQVLQHKIADLEIKIANFEKFGIGSGNLQWLGIWVWNRAACNGKNGNSRHQDFMVN